MVRRPPPMPTILIDSNEKAHGYQYSFDGFQTQVANLQTGDYSLQGHEERVAVERKTKADWYGCLAGRGGENRRRFRDCLGRLSLLDSACIVIECSLDDLALPPAYSTRTGRQSLGAYISWAQEFRIPILPCPSREWAEKAALRWLQAYWRHHLRDTMTAPRSAPKPTTTAPPGTTSTGR